MLPVHLQHDKPFLVQGDQASSLGLGLSPCIGVHYQVGSAQHDRPFFRPAHRAIAWLTHGATWEECVCQFSVYRSGMTWQASCWVGRESPVPWSSVELQA